MFEEVDFNLTFDDKLKEQAEKESRLKTSDLKFYLLIAGFIVLGAFIITKIDK